MLKWNQAVLSLWIPPLNSCIITDLDGCAVDSSHRQHCNPDGTLNLQDWREHSTPELIAQDKLTLWGKRLAELENRMDLTIGACTSRFMANADFDYLAEHFNMQRNSGLIWSRPENCFLSDAGLKEKLFTDARTIYGNFDLTLALNLGKLFFVDDLEANCRVAEQLGLQAIHVID